MSDQTRLGSPTWPFIVMPLLQIGVGLGFLELLMKFFAPGLREAVWPVIVISLIAAVIGFIDAIIIRRSNNASVLSANLFGGFLISMMVVAGLIVLAFIAYFALEYFYYGNFQGDDPSEGAGLSYALIFAVFALIGCFVLRLLWFVTAVIVGKLSFLVVNKA